MSMLANRYFADGKEVSVVVTNQSGKEANLSRFNEKIKVYFLNDETAGRKKHRAGTLAQVLFSNFYERVGKILSPDSADYALIHKFKARHYEKFIWLRHFLRDNRGATTVAFLNYSIFLSLVSACPDTNVVISDRGDPRMIFPNPTNAAFIRKKYGRANHMVFQSPDARKWYVENIGIDGPVIFNPVKGDLPEPYSGERKKRIVNFCRICRQKNPFLLLDAFEKFHDGHPDYELWLYGDEEPTEKEYVQDFLKAVSGSKCSSAIHIMPAISNIHETIRDCAMFVSSSDYEGMSNSMLEAMALGLPTVCTDCPAGGARAIIEDGVNGLLTPVGDADALYKAMKEIAENPALAKKLSENGVKIRETQNTERIIKKWTEIV